MVTLASNYRKALKNIKSDSVQGTDYEYSGISYQVVASKEKQRVTNKIRKFLGLKKAKSGPLYASKVTNGFVIGDDSSTETDDSTATYSSSTQQTYTTPATTYSSSSVQPTAPTTDTTTTNNNTGGQ
ncbi:hypothetical protein ATX32_10045 [Oenococcus oeni]|nr:hypothetical protein ATX32_10045 [Oenococcus oeni]